MEVKYTKSELMVVTGSRELKDGYVVVVGLGLPQIAAMLAKATHAPNITLVLENGVINPDPIHPSVGLADPRIWYGATTFTNGFIGTLGRICHKGIVDIGFLGGLEVDRYGNVNSTLIRKDSGGMRHFTGSGGANDIASLAREILIIIRHEPRKLCKTISYITSPGFLKGGKSREQSFLTGGGPRKIITDKVVFVFDPDTRKAVVHSIHPGVTPREVIENTGFEIEIPEDVQVTPTPTEREIFLIRNQIDSEGQYTQKD